MAKEKAKDKLPPHLIPDGRYQRCSVCKMPFLADSDRSLSEDFANHVQRLHKPGQTAEDVNQAAARIVREATEKL
jgi:DNA-binding helix-hairpin-helix protein with protein kinase domain